MPRRDVINGEEFLATAIYFSSIFSLGIIILIVEIVVRLIVIFNYFKRAKCK